MLKNRLQVLAACALLLAPALAARAQPTAAPEQAPEMPLLPLGLEDWLALKGGLTRFKFEAQNATAAEIARALREQTGLDVEITDDMALPLENPPRYSIEAAGQPLWEAVAMWKRGNKALGLKESYLSGRWTLSPWNVMREGAGLSAGPCFLAATHLSIERAATLKAQNQLGDASNFLTIEVSIRIDPRFAPQVLALAPQMESAVDDKGRSVAVSKQAQLEWPRGTELNVFPHLEAPAGDARFLRSVKGTLRLAVQTQGERWEVDLEEAGPRQKSFKSDASQVTARFEKLESQGEGWVVKLSFEQKSLGANRVFKSRDDNWWAELSSAFEGRSGVSVLSASGRKMFSTGSQDKSSFENGVHKSSTEIRYDAADSPPTKLIVEVPLEWREVQIPFEFKDIPLP